MKKIYIVLCALLFSFGMLAQSTRPSIKDKQETTDTTRRILQEVTVTSRYYRKYKLDRSSNTLKVQTPVLEQPQNIQEVDKSIITDQQAININESVTRNVSGAVRNNTADFYGPAIYMRGAPISTLRNGVNLTMIYFGPIPEDAAIIDRMEFIKGPAGFLNAIGDPAGSFNIVTKSPAGISSNNITLTAGSFNLYRLTGDFEGNFDKNKKWQYRLNVVGQKAKSFEKYAFNDKILANPVIKYVINSHSSISAEYIYQQQKFMQYLLTVFSPYGFASLPSDFSITDPGKKPGTASENNGFLTYQNNLNSKWQITARTAFALSHLDGNYFFVSKYTIASPAVVQRRVTYEKFHSNVYSFQAYVNGTFATGKIIHKVLGGADANKKSLLAYSGYNDPGANQALYPLDVNNPVYGISFNSNKKEGDLKKIATNKQAVQYVAAYAQDELNMLDQKLRLTVAARITSSKSSIYIPTVSHVSDVVLTPRIGISYSITKNLTVYAVHDQTYSPQSGISATGHVFEPLKGKNREAGVKKDWADAKWNTSVSVYDITRDNIIVTDPATNLQSQIGQTTSKGIEFDLKGEIVKGLNAVLNYAYTDSHISKDANKANVGLYSPYLVKHIQNTWLNYKLPLHVQGFTLSAGYQLQAGRTGRYPQDGNIRVANIFRVDGGLGWANSRLSVNALVNNVFNRFNYGSAWTRPVGLYAYVPFPPREFRVAAGFTF